ncbi:MAG: patatin family protein [Lachnospiraceae bacterium]|nr:patatin family protein [Lachnospiraceae bacterium]
MKKGLALEGGAMRGMFTCGVIDVFMENGVEFDGISGISAGAIFGCNYKSKQIGRGVRYNKKWGRDPRYFGFRSLIITGDLYGRDFCYHRIIDELDPIDKEAYKNNPIDFFVGATDVEEAVIRYHNCKIVDTETIEWMRASASMPLVSNIVEVSGYKLLDGGVINPIPYKILEENGYDKIVVILTQPRGFVKKKTSIIPIMRIAMHKYRKFVDAMARRHIVYNEETKELKEKEKIGEVFIISPETSLGIKRTENNPNELERVYQIGRNEAKKNLERVKNFLS